MARRRSGSIEKRLREMMLIGGWSRETESRSSEEFQGLRLLPVLLTKYGPVLGTSVNTLRYCWSCDHSSYVTWCHVDRHVFARLGSGIPAIRTYVQIKSYIEII